MPWTARGPSCPSWARHSFSWTWGPGTATQARNRETENSVKLKKLSPNFQPSPKFPMSPIVNQNPKSKITIGIIAVIYKHDLLFTEQCSGNARLVYVDWKSPSLFYFLPFLTVRLPVGHSTSFWEEVIACLAPQQWTSEAKQLPSLHSKEISYLTTTYSLIKAVHMFVELIRIETNFGLTKITDLRRTLRWACEVRPPDNVGPWSSPRTPLLFLLPGILSFPKLPAWSVAWSCVRHGSSRAFICTSISILFCKPINIFLLIEFITY